MSRAGICRLLKLTISDFLKITSYLGIEKTANYSNEDVVRIKAGVEFKHYVWTRDLQRFWIWYGFCPNGLKEIKIEL